MEVIIDRFNFMKTESRLSSKERKRQVDQSKINVIQMEKGECEIPVAAASIIAKRIFEDEARKLSEKYKIDFKTVSPEAVPSEILPMVAKTNFKNIKKLVSPKYYSTLSLKELEHHTNNIGNSRYLHIILKAVVKIFPSAYLINL